MESKLNMLPPEILQSILACLPISSLLSFARTNQSNYVSATQALSTLELAVLPRKIHSTLTFVGGQHETTIDHTDFGKPEGTAESYCSPRGRTSVPSWRPQGRDRELYQIGLLSQPHGAVSACNAHSTEARSLTTSRRPSNRTRVRSSLRVPRLIESTSDSPLEVRVREIDAQNKLAESVLLAPSLRNLRSLSLHLYDLSTPKLASALATSFPNLQYLSLNFSHPFIYDTTVPPRYWRSTPTAGTGSPAWNALSGIGDQNSSHLTLRNLRTLTLNRSSITSFQLRSWIKANPSLRNIHLDKVRGVDNEFVTWLGGYIYDQRRRIQLSSPNTTSSSSSTRPARMEKIALHNCAELKCQTEEQFEWIGQIAASPSNQHSTSTSTARPPTQTQTQTKTSSIADLTFLSLKSCPSVDDGLFIRLTNDHSWTESISTLISPGGTTIVKTPASMPTQTARTTRTAKARDGDLSRAGSLSPPPFSSSSSSSTLMRKYQYQYQHQHQHSGDPDLEIESERGSDEDNDNGNDNDNDNDHDMMGIEIEIDPDA